jgi:hypothetical protein
VLAKSNDSGAAETSTYEDLRIEDGAFLLDGLGYLGRELLRSYVRSMYPSQYIHLHALNCSETASVVHRTLASSARRSNAAWADELDSTWAREHSASPACNAFFD